MRRDLRSKVGGFLMVDFVVGRDIREVLDLVRVRCDIGGDRDARGGIYNSEKSVTLTRTLGSLHI